MIRRIPASLPEALHGMEATRVAEKRAAALLPPYALMDSAGLAVARLTRALHPHPRCIWVACGPGNNGGDGLIAATHLHLWAAGTGGRTRVVVTHGSARTGFEKASMPPDARHALDAAHAAGVHICSDAPPEFDLGIDAVLGIGASRPLSGELAHWASLLRTTDRPVICVDLPTGLHADTGELQPLSVNQETPFARATGPRHTLSLLTLKPGLFTATGRDAAGEVWFDDLRVHADCLPSPVAWLHATSMNRNLHLGRPHASHKGTFGDVVIVGGQDIGTDGEGMTGAAILAACAALHGGAGRVFVNLIGATTGPTLRYHPDAPELMFRSTPKLLASTLMEQGTVVCGCGGGDAVQALLPDVLQRAARLVLDADALNAIARSPALQAMVKARRARQWVTVLTPHPLEAARLLGSTAPDVMKDRLACAQQLAQMLEAVVVLKGSGTVTAAPDQVPRINASGNGHLATAGTGDVLAGMLGAALAAPSERNAEAVFDQVLYAVFQHGALADYWEHTPGFSQEPFPRPTLTASSLARQVRHLG
jgi:hydroxyethylthiazole kinase-like uncharacterized protein yjeF